MMNKVSAATLAIVGSGANAKLVIENYGVIKLAELQRFYKHTTDESAPKQQVITIKPFFPANKSIENFEAGFEVKRTQELTGFAQHMLTDIKRYNGIIDRLRPEKSGYIDELDAAEIATQAVALIRKHDGAIVIGKATIPVTLTGGQNAALTIEAPELKKTVVIAAAGAVDTIAKLKTAIDASALGGFVIVNTSTGRLETEYALKITGTDKIAFGYPDVELVGKQAIPSFLVMDIDGVATVKSITEAERASFTQADVARLFPIKWEHAGTQPLVPIPGLEYCKYRFEVKHNMAYALDGANHIDSYIEQVEFYLPKDVAEASNGVNWDNKLYNFIGTSGHDRSKLVHA